MSTCRSAASSLNRFSRTDSKLKVNFYLSHRLRLLFPASRRRDAERLHLPIEVTALHAEDFGGSRHVALLGRERSQDEIPLELIARLVQGAPLAQHLRYCRSRESRRIEEAQIR